MATATTTSEPGSGLAAALHASGPAPEHADKLMLFGRFVGCWTLQMERRRATGHGDRRIALRLGPRRSRRPRHLDRPRPRTARRGPAAAGIPWLDDPIL